MPSHPVLIVNPRSGNGRADAIGLSRAAHGIGLETVPMRPGDDLATLANNIVDQGCDHLLMAGGDGSLAIVAEIAMNRQIPFSCVPVGTRNHFAMDLGLDRRHPLRSLDAAFDGLEKSIDVGVVAGRVFLNNASFGLYPRAIADPDYRNHRARSMAGAAVATARSLNTQITMTLPDGQVIADVEILLISNNPYRFIGPPDFARRPALDTDTLGIVMADRDTRIKRGPAAFKRLEAPRITIHSDLADIRAGVDGELMTLHAPIEISLAPKSLRVLTPRHTQIGSFRESIEQLNERAIFHLSGLPALPSREELTDKSPLLRRLDQLDEQVFERIAGWESPAMDRFMPALSEAASHSKIWIAIAAAMSLFGGRKGRRAAAQGLVAVGITSFLANMVAKGVFRRPRPTDEVPEARRLPQPASTSMPSGHTASAAAFARVAGAAYPGMRGSFTTLAAAIGFSRVYTGVHHPTDVIAGWLLGRGIGASVRGVTDTAERMGRIFTRPR